MFKDIFSFALANLYNLSLNSKINWWRILCWIFFWLSDWWPWLAPYNFTAFSFTEETFFLSSLHEVVKVWSRGSGQANFALKVIDGVAELNLNFKLGHPNDLHCAPPHNVPPSYQDQDLAPPGLKKRRHHKSAARRERDRLRAQAFQAGRETGRETRKPSLILPFLVKSFLSTMSPKLSLQLHQLLLLK